MTGRRHAEHILSRQREGLNKFVQKSLGFFFKPPKLRFRKFYAQNAKSKGATFGRLRVGVSKAFFINNRMRLSNVQFRLAAWVRHARSHGHLRSGDRSQSKCIAGKQGKESDHSSHVSEIQSDDRRGRLERCKPRRQAASAIVGAGQLCYYTGFVLHPFGPTRRRAGTGKFLFSPATRFRHRGASVRQLPPLPFCYG